MYAILGAVFGAAAMIFLIFVVGRLVK